MWIVAKVKSYSQEKIKKRIFLEGMNFFEKIDEFYYPFYEIEEEVEEKKRKKILTPTLLFINFNFIDFGVLSRWLVLEPNLLWFYRGEDNVSIINEREMRKFRKGVIKYIKKEKKRRKSFMVGDIAQIIRPSALAGYIGRIKKVGKNHIILKVFNIELESEWKILKSCVSLIKDFKRHGE